MVGLRYQRGCPRNDRQARVHKLRLPGQGFAGETEPIHVDELTRRVNDNGLGSRRHKVADPAMSAVVMRIRSMPGMPGVHMDEEARARDQGHEAGQHEDGNQAPEHAVGRARTSHGWVLLCITYQFAI
jgi:hypothetical protein